MMMIAEMFRAFETRQTGALTSRATPQPPPPPDPNPPPPAGSLSGGQLGALLGSVLGFAFLVLLLCCCMVLRRRRLRTRYMEEDDNVSESEMVRVETLRRPPAWNQSRPHGTTNTWTTVPPPVWFPPTPRHTPYRQTRNPQIPGVRRYP